MRLHFVHFISKTWEQKVASNLFFDLHMMMMMMTIYINWDVIPRQKVTMKWFFYVCDSSRMSLILFKNNFNYNSFCEMSPSAMTMINASSYMWVNFFYFSTFYTHCDILSFILRAPHLSLAFSAMNILNAKMIVQWNILNMFMH